MPPVGATPLSSDRFPRVWFDISLSLWGGYRCVRCARPGLHLLCSACKACPLAPTRTKDGHLVHALGDYDEPVGEEIRSLKYGDSTFRAAGLGAALRNILPGEWQLGTLVPVPLHPERLAERGYNQSALIARGLAKAHAMPLRLDCVVRNKSTSAQARAAGSMRTSNVQNAFTCPRRLDELPIVLLDDVVTTGSTADACAHALSAAGARVLGIVCCARSGHP